MNGNMYGVNKDRVDELFEVIGWIILIYSIRYS
jgi:hypothetical protein